LVSVPLLCDTDADVLGIRDVFVEARGQDKGVLLAGTIVVAVILTQNLFSKSGNFS